MAVLRMVVIVRAVKVGGHHGNEVRTVLPVQELAVLQAADLCQGVCFIGLFQRSCQKT